MNQTSHEDKALVGLSMAVSELSMELKEAHSEIGQWKERYISEKARNDEM
jgi:hypothetical protein